jgi:hypothetical protein
VSFLIHSRSANDIDGFDLYRFCTNINISNKYEINL